MIYEHTKYVRLSKIKNERAFTLIELLAVIAILAIIMIIAVPTVLNTVSSAKKGAFKDSVLGLFKSANNATVADIDNMEEIDQFFVDDTRLNLDNKVFTSGVIIRINEKFRVFNVSNGEYCANGYADNLEITQTNCKAEPTPETCFIFDENSGGITGYNGITAECTEVVIIPNTIKGKTVTRIENNAFKSKNLTGVLLTNNITYVGDYAFANNKLTDNTYVVPSNSVYFGVGYFNNNTLNQEQFIYQPGSNNTILTGYAGSSKVISIPEGVEKIGNYAFSDLSITNVSLPDSLKEIGNYAFYNNKLTSIDLKNVETIRGYAFGLNQIKSVSIPNSVKLLDNGVFKANQISNLVIPNNYITFGVEVFTNNQLPDNQAFIYSKKTDGTNDMTNLISYGGAKRSGIIIPNNVVSIKDYALQLSSITSITLNEGLKTIGQYALNGNALTTITIPSTVTSIGDSGFRSNKLTNITFSNYSGITFAARVFSNNQLADDKAFIYDPKDSTRVVSYGGAKKSGVVIPEGVKTLGTLSLASIGLSSVTLPSTLLKIEYGALAENNLTNLIIPSSVTSIASYAVNSNQLPDSQAFVYDPTNKTKLVSYGGANRTTVTLPSNTKVIASQSFGWTNVKNIVIPEGVTSIETSAFSGNYLETISLPSTLTSIGSSAFTPASNTIRSVRIAGDPTRFNSVWASIGFPAYITPTN